jgi:hypothetical protein
MLHSWGSALTHHPHVHIIVPGGGISLDGQRWILCRPGFFLPVRVLSRLFGRLFLEKLIAAHHVGRLQFFGDHLGLAEPRVFTAYLAPLRRTEWVVYSKRPFGGPEAVLTYLSRYTHPGCDFQQPPDRHHQYQRDLQVEGLPRQPARPGQGHDARYRSEADAGPEVLIESAETGGNRLQRHAAQARERIAGSGLAARCDAVDGHARVTVPVGADAYLMKSVLHGRTDDEAGVEVRFARDSPLEGTGFELLVRGRSEAGCRAP